MKKILFLTPFVPSNKAGGENFTRLLLENLSLTCKVDLLYFRYADDAAYVCPNENVKVIKELVNSTKVKLKNYLRCPFFHPIFSIRFSRKILRFVQNLMEENHYDLLFLDHSQMALYGEFFPNIPKILMSHDVMAQRFSRAGNWLNKKLIVAGERRLMSQPNLMVFTFSEKDREIIRNTYGIDSRVTHFFLDENVIKAEPSKIEKRIVFLGKWKRADNFDGLKWFFDNVYEQIDKSIAIVIIGKWLPDDFQTRVLTLGNVEHLGFVDNPYPLIANSIATISPLFSGAGVKVKVVESLACGTPVVGNQIAFEGISAQYNSFMLQAETPSQYAAMINSIELSVETRQSFKKGFMTTYQESSICRFINSK